MTKSTRFKNSVLAVVLSTAPLMTVNNLALADSEASLQGGSQASTQNSDQSEHFSTSTAGTQNSAEASRENSSSASTQNQSQASVEAGRPPNGSSNIVPGTNPAPFAVGREAQSIARKNAAAAKPSDAAPKATTNRSASVKAPKTKTVNYHWGH